MNHGVTVVTSAGKTVQIMYNNHTPLPWTKGKGKVRIKNECHKMHNLVAECYTTSNSLRYPSESEREANTDFIIHACNNHYKLVEALRTISNMSKDDSDVTMEHIINYANETLNTL
jgi:RecJ-like exonuclease